MIDISKTTRAPDYARQMNAISPGYPCATCDTDATGECSNYKHCKAYREWMTAVWGKTRENVRKVVHTKEVNRK